MKKILLILVFLSFINVTLAADNCTKEFNPVCDTEGKMYANECLLKSEGAELDSSYKYIDNNCVRSEIVCTKEFNPVCSTKGVMFGNKCELESKGAILDETYEVIDNTCVKVELNCTKEYVPVCGVDGNIYDNKCVAKTEGVELDNTKYVNSNKECADVADSLRGERKLVSFNGNEVNKTINVKFDGKQISSQICNHIGGEYSLNGVQLSAEGIFRTEMLCEDEEMMNIEDNFILHGAEILLGNLGDSKTLTIETTNGLVYEFDELTELDQISSIFNKYFEKHSNKFTTLKDKKDFVEKTYSKLEKKSQNVKKKYEEQYKSLLNVIAKYKETL